MTPVFTRQSVYHFLHREWLLEQLDHETTANKNSTFAHWSIAIPELLTRFLTLLHGLRLHGTFAPFGEYLPLAFSGREC